MKNIHDKLLSWYEHHGRHELPWRNTNDIYAIYLSEVMLQQTQVNRVQEEYYPKFLERFPTLEELANAPLDEVLALWSGLGYYSRARNLHECAKQSNGFLSDCPKKLMKLPGIGRYTASAVCSFGYHQTIPVVDTNIARVLRRFFALGSGDDRLVWQKAEEFLNPNQTRSHNLALMDLGSMVCLPKTPQCSLCPLQDGCEGKEYPMQFTHTKKKEYESLELFYGVWIQDGKIALTPATGTMYRGMYELPSVDPIDEDLLGSYKHSYTKYRLNVALYAIDSCAQEVVWADLESFDTLPISSLTKKAKSHIVHDKRMSVR
jgi:A/G-specific adenine glycosylase